MKSWLSTLVSLVIGTPEEKTHGWAAILIVLGIVTLVCVMLAVGF